MVVRTPQIPTAGGESGAVEGEASARTTSRGPAVLREGRPPESGQPAVWQAGKNARPSWSDRKPPDGCCSECTMPPRGSQRLPAATRAWASMASPQAPPVHNQSPTAPYSLLYHASQAPGRSGPATRGRDRLCVAVRRFPRCPRCRFAPLRGATDHLPQLTSGGARPSCSHTPPLTAGGEERKMMLHNPCIINARSGAAHAPARCNLMHRGKVSC